MSRSKALFVLLIVAAAVGAAVYVRDGNIQAVVEGFSERSGAVADMARRLSSVEEIVAWFPPLKWIVGDKAPPQTRPSGPPQRTVGVEVATAVKKKSPVILEGLGNVTMMASVAVRPRIDS